MRYQTAPHSDILLFYDLENVMINLINFIIAIEVHIIGLNSNLVNTFFKLFSKIVESIIKPLNQQQSLVRIKRYDTHFSCVGFHHTLLI